MSLQVKYAIITNKGLVRSINEDIINAGTVHKVDTSGAPIRMNYMMVCDGMGGMKAGETASRLAATTVMDYINAMPFWPTLEDDIKDQLIGTLIAAHQNIKMLAKYDFDKNGMGTTIVLMIIVKNRAYITWSGDSRAYILTNQPNFAVGMDVKGLRLLTKDHSASWGMVEKGLLTIDQVRNHPQSNALTQSLGGEHPPTPDFISFEVSNTDRLLVCTDGVYLHIETSELRDVLKDYKNPDQGISVIQDIILSRGAKDNFSLGIVDIIDAQWSDPLLTAAGAPSVNDSQKSHTWYYFVGFGIICLLFWWLWNKGIFQNTSSILNKKVPFNYYNPDVTVDYADSLQRSIERLNIQADKMVISTTALVFKNDIENVAASIPSETVAKIVSNPTVASSFSKPTSKPVDIKPTIKPASAKKPLHKEKAKLYDDIYNDVLAHITEYTASHPNTDIYQQAYLIRLEQLLMEINEKRDSNDYTNSMRTNWQLEFLRNKFEMIQSKYKPE